MGFNDQPNQFISLFLIETFIPARDRLTLQTGCILLTKQLIILEVQLLSLSDRLLHKIPVHVICML